MQEEQSNNTHDWYDLLTKEELESINRGIKDFEKGRVHPHEAALEVYGKYLKDI